ncbi:MAG: TetR/AcrR family transcriptional regulator [Furfurilactobacillus sp.]|jgi:AcrR family transcriptional regulator|uniref:TetR/AcrR family transcriptional regulator n=2 Tax=Furfurilactobacillus TaxID=2767882 RepID=A0ABT6DB47_9LACO|nr:MULTISPECIES: TetR/AcrR family transcriptional regulator [Furfurilactobacillus]QLE65392.1 transcriptional regulator TetR [Furfurilactobacillus rossiae]MCF6160892.1 TetR/AcrR family transcriptional regulator [Furfurilactobacillus milii]MCF6163342.1 TetR/AcrR family transcriptional regulator [Furfurilactobacillus milii]MCH4011909.1 TetR/AcrR family transcriptional regulator [Furfurilactobacillus sp.]MCH4037801.1 TetR/AcrR family transcriptional regulator [Furfurilactobacillus sp.]
MKQQTKKITRGAQRTLSAFSNAMSQALTQQSFEAVTVNNLCQQANYPRSTFYNYFEDKYDLLNYCFSLIVAEIHLNELAIGDEGQILLTCFDRLYDLIDQHKAYVAKVLVHNQDGFLLAGFTNYAQQVGQKLLVDKIAVVQELPAELVVAHCFATISMVLNWVFVKQNQLTKQDARLYLVRLYGKPGLAETK